ncbi:MAG: hypothetical protein ABJN34_08970 [Litoreibacter sp.]|uniref:hypothetical protein n=1 Tax=Litoreibacter sp. TaxID=1969459 RepID=UPI00329995CC
MSLFPAILIMALAFPQLYETAVGFVGLALVCGVLTIASHFARTRGKKVEQRLNAKWGGKPTTRFLLDDNSELDDQTRNRYLAHFSKNVPDWNLGEDPKQGVESAVRWLLENTRDTSAYGLIFKENISYGFRRNCLGMKPIGSLISMICAIYWGTQLYIQLPALSETRPTDLIGLSVSAALVLWWLFVVGEEWVKEAGNSYAKALLGSIDTMG